MKRPLIALAALVATPLAFAQAGGSPSAQAGGSPYASLNYGQAKYDIECATGLSCDETDKAYKLGLGWQFNRYLAAELAYTDLGQTNLDGPGFGAFLHATAYELSAVGTYPLGNSIVSALGRLGLAYGTSKYGRDLGGEKTSTSLTYGAGLQLDFSKNVAARLQWQRYHLKAQIQSPTSEAEESGNVDMLSLGILLRAR